MWVPLNIAQQSRKYFWAVHLVFISLFAYVAAGIANVAVEAVIASLTDMEPLPIVARDAPVRMVTPLCLAQLAKLTGLPVSEADRVKPAAWPADELASQPIQSALRVKLLGTLLAVHPQWSLASILDLGTNRAQTYWIGDKLEGAEILEIERDRAIILNNHRREYIDGAAAATRAKGDEVPRSSVPSTGIRAISENEYEVLRGEIDRTLANFTEVATQARIFPVSKDGQVQGFKLFSIRPDSIYTKVGIQNGDVIRKINGYELNSVEKALELYTKLKDANRIDIEYERGGFKGHRTYNIH